MKEKQIYWYDDDGGAMVATIQFPPVIISWKSESVNAGLYANIYRPRTLVVNMGKYKLHFKSTF